MSKPKVKYAVIDIEATCWEYNDPNKQPHETIEIGAVLLDENYEKIRDRGCFVLPQYNKILSDFCVDLTGITQEMLDTEGIPFPEAMKSLAKQINQDTIFCSWGYFDKSQLMKECEDWDVPYPFSDEHINVKTEFMTKFKKKKCGLQKACRMLHLRFNGSPHRGIDDARMIAEIFKLLRVEDPK